MTRFARAKGSKASNEKTPEDGTPWEVMKEQLLKAKKESEESKKRQEAEKQRIENYENFLKDQRVQRRSATWCDFPETEPRKENSNMAVQPSKKKKNKLESVPRSSSNTLNIESDIEAVSNKKVKNKRKLENPDLLEVDPNSVYADVSSEKTTKKKNKNKVAKTIENSYIVAKLNEDSTEGPEQKKKKKLATIESSQVEASSNEIQAMPQQSLKKKNNKKQKQISHPSESDARNKVSILQNKEEQISSFKKNKNNEETPALQAINKQNKQKAKKKKKLVNGQPVRRKEINDRSFPIIINGKEVELVRFDGFPIMKKDAERLTELKNNMIKKGIPKSEVQRTMKLERRRAEKALARVKRDVCYNCRKGGHNLSDCPELKSVMPGADAAEGVCFKCGSTEHRQFECKVQRDKEFRFATCFICKEQGHIARQCPDNPKGLYPNGGGCKLCGDVTHLRKDCPTVNNKKEETSVKLQTWVSSNNIEDVGSQNKPFTYDDSVKKHKKITF